ncbi:MAG: imidazole glycerol phosphate synthase subunit HisH [Lentisphaeraceae bacterium]|nr:imidazole glycerol phosphate synthase subunit HisH [Lentisphaeraceae bacterium]
MKIGVIDYGVAGNVFNIAKAVEKAGGEVGIIKEQSNFKLYDKYILPGVGAFPDAISEIDKLGIKETLKTELGEKPTLGICLGMQILCKIGFEFEETKGLNFFNAEVVPIKCKGKIPRMGFGKIELTTKESSLFNGITDEDEFYFMHSYEVVNYTDVTALSTFYGHQYVCAIQKGNLFGVQFHPEKSRDAGIRIFQNFINL